MSQKTIFTTLFILVHILIFATTIISADAGVLSSTVAKVSARKAAQKAATKKAMEKAAAEKVVVKKAEAKQAVKQAEKGVISEQEKNKAVLAWDKARDKTIPVKPMEKPRTVNRYTSMEQAKKEKINGIAPNTHMAAKEVGAGRPLSSATAKYRYGLAKEPEARITIAIPKGQPARNGKVINGQPGFGEITSSKKIPPENIIGIHPIP